MASFRRHEIVSVTVRVKVRLSLWQAFKLRVAGGRAFERLLQAQLEVHPEDPPDGGGERQAA
jgi:hypothetical protein